MGKAILIYLLVLFTVFMCTAEKVPSDAKDKAVILSIFGSIIMLISVLLSN